MTSKNSSNRLVIFLLVALAGGAVGYQFFTQNASQNADAATVTKPGEQPKPKQVIDAALITPKPNDIILGDNNATTTIVEYSSLTCPHCAHFHGDVLPKLQKEFIDTGKVKLVVRHFPLNEAAMRAAQLVECAGKNGLKREAFLKVLFEMQNQWAFSERFLADALKITSIGGLDSAAAESCLADKDLETHILTMRQIGETKLGIASTPSFFINGEKMDTPPTIENFREALGKAKDSK